MALDVYTSTGARLTSPQLPTYVTSLPSGPIDGQEVYYAADATNGVIWHLRYRSASSSSYKWEFVGGRGLYNFIATTESTTSSTFGNLATDGPKVTIPLAGDYDVAWSFANVNTASGNQSTTAVCQNTTFKMDAYVYAAVNSNYQIGGRAGYRLTGLAASDVVRLQYKVSGGTGSFLDRWLQITPVRVG